MPRKKKPVDTIKVEGLTPESVKEFEPREDSSKDEVLWEEYFKGSPNLLKLPLKKDVREPQSNDEQLEKTQEKEQSNQEPKESTPVHTGVDTPVDKAGQETKLKERKTRDEYVSLDATHTAMEAKVYSVIYRETVVKGNEPQHFGALRLMKLTGIGSDKTIRKAIRGLIAKKSIALIDPYPNHPLGPIYTAFPPKEILAARKKAGIKIHPQTKKIITSDEPSGVSTGVRTGVSTPVSTPVKNTPVTPVKSTGVPDDTPYIYINYINNDDDSIESSSSNYIDKSSDDDDLVFNHKNYVVSLYEKYTGNKWRVGDDEFYESIKDVLPDIIEAAMIASVLRSESKINSFAYCEGAIYEFQENLPPGYLGYLREKWGEEVKGRGMTEEATSRNLTSSVTTPETDEISIPCLPKDSYFQEKWLKNYLSTFPKEEHPRIKKLAERFDHFMLTAGKRKEWVKNPTGTFIGLVRGEVNVPLPQYAPSFETRVAEEKRAEKERLEREEEERRKEEIEKEIKEAILSLEGYVRDKFIRGAKKKYNLNRVGDDESILDTVVYYILYELDERQEEDWRKVWEVINKSGEE